MSLLTLPPFSVQRYQISSVNKKKIKDAGMKFERNDLEGSLCGSKEDKFRRNLILNEIFDNGEIVR